MKVIYGSNQKFEIINSTQKDVEIRNWHCVL